MHNPIGILEMADGLTDWHHRNVAAAEELQASHHIMSLEGTINNESNYYLIVRDGYSPTILVRKIEGQPESQPRGIHTPMY